MREELIFLCNIEFLRLNVSSHTLEAVKTFRSNSSAILLAFNLIVMPKT